MNKLFKAVTMAAIIGVTAPSLGFAEDWDMPTPYPDKTFHTVNIQQFADEVSEATGGKLNIKLHTAGSLIKHGEIKNSVRNKIVPAGEFSCRFWQTKTLHLASTLCHWLRQATKMLPIFGKRKNQLWKSYWPNNV